MITKEKAREIAQGFLLAGSGSAAPAEELAIVDESTRETEFGWIFFYNSRRFLETGDIRYALCGNAPLIVNKFDGSIQVTGTAEPVEVYAEQYLANLERRAKRWGLVVTQVPGDRTATMHALRKSLGLTLDEVREAMGSIPGVLYRGARVDLEPVLVKLRSVGIECELQECAPLEALPN